MRFNASMVVWAGLLMAAAPPQVPKDGQSTNEPRSGPGAGQRFLERFAGDWDVIKTFYPRSGDPIRVEGQCRQSMIHEGRFLQSEFSFRQGETKTTGLGIIGFEPGPGTFTSIWTDSRSTQMSVRQSRDRFDGESVVLYSRSLDADGKDLRRSRTVTRLEEDGRKIVHRQYALGPDGEERLMMELLMTRRVGTSSPGK